MKIGKSSILAALSSAAALMLGATAVQAATIQSMTHSTRGVEQLYYSQGITIGSRHDWDTISFAFDLQGGSGFEAYSAGDLYILTENHLGSAEDLDSSTSGFLAKNNGFENGFWTFDRDVTLVADTTYYFVMGDRETATATQIFGNQDLTGSGLGFSGSAFGDFMSTTGDLDFALNGEIATPVPLPATALMLLAGLGSLGAVAARRRRG
ncbi:VPLPA-CTERM sorting domain-containing protein [Sedimentitalea todarodis]|uniref:VPLPA-CTERM sorting domain-containing protein n=1 Tax=Sedimentitalea todarodis TaxID=1631240 RepID=A0ABU3V826_9RHOB|nr:VPLPA-CTERM sorting domain-containing protein [Sedimentitalea todarodis]MDU9002263.1 VPLPA-CTERM sorting domain-containing protein [Sedimentitalea todarodis]